MIERAKPTQARKSLELANVFVKSGVRFVPMPCADDAEYDRLVDQCIANLNDIERAAEAAAPTAEGEKK